MVRRLSAVLFAAAIALCVLQLPAKADAPDPLRPLDFLKVGGLSQPRFRTVRDALDVAMPDGVRLYVEIVRPAAPGRFGVILEASPYHGTLADRAGTRILPEPRDANDVSIGLTGYFAPRGYAVVMVDLRGTGRSGGCLDHLGYKDASDLKAIVEWAASQPWSNGRVGMTGHSYVGSTPMVAAAQRPRGLVTIVPSAGLASMYHHQFQAGVPYNAQWLGTMYAYEQLAFERFLPPPLAKGDDVGGDDAAFVGCGMPNSSLVAGDDQLSGRYSTWHSERDHGGGATAAPIPVFVVHGVNDDAARVAAMDWFTARRGRAGDKLWLGQWSHGSGCCPNRRGMQWTRALHAWFDRHLLVRDVPTGPPVEMFLADGTFGEVRNGARAEIQTASAWPPPSRTLELYPSAQDLALSEARPDRPAQLSFSSLPSSGTGLLFRSAPRLGDLVFAGVPDLTLVTSVTSPRVQLIATVYDEDAEGTLRRITQFAINPELREGISVARPAVARERYSLRPPGFAMAHHLRAGHRLALRVHTSDPDKLGTFTIDTGIHVFTGPGGTVLRLPVVDPRLYPDNMALR